MCVTVSIHMYVHVYMCTLICAYVCVQMCTTVGRYIQVRGQPREVVPHLPPYLDVEPSVPFGAARLWPVSAE